MRGARVSMAGCVLASIAPMVLMIGWMTARPALASNGDPMLDENEVDVPVGSEPEGLENDIDEAEAFESELQASGGELRGRDTYGLAVGVGQSAPWQQYTLAASWSWTRDIAVVGQVGGGRFVTLGTRDGTTYEMDSRAKAVTAGARWYMGETVPFFVEGVVGLTIWSGDLNPTSGRTTEGLRLDSDFDARGVVGGVTTGLEWRWENRMFVECHLIGMSRAALLAKTADNDDALDVVNRELRRAGSWGLLNLRVGVSF